MRGLEALDDEATLLFQWAQATIAGSGPAGLVSSQAPPAGLCGDIIVSHRLCDGARDGEGPRSAHRAPWRA